MQKKYDPNVSEPKWQRYWEKHNIFKFNENSKSEIYSIDTPPPTVSGKMHIGHAFSYSQQDFIARFQRMLGKNVFYPFGTDNNGLATERLIEKTKKIKATKMDRQEFEKLCLDTLKKELVPKYMDDMKSIGMSCDWNLFYTTIDNHCQAISQRSFIDLFNDNRIYRKKSPMMICPQCNTAIAQVEMEDQEKKSTLNYIKASLDSGEKLIFATTRPEVLHACVGITLNKNRIYVKAQKDSEIWIMSKEAFEKFKDQWELTLKEKIEGKKLVDQVATIPISNAKIIIKHDPESKTEFGSGIVYWCTYGGTECIEFLVRHKDVKPIHIMDLSGKYNSLTENLEGLNSLEARKQILQNLEDNNYLALKENIKHVVNVHERCGTDIEYVATEQWFIKYLDLKEKFLEDGSRLNWFPHHMKHRLDNWIKGLKWDWCISRQRFFGVPFPLWYCKSCGKVILANKDHLPIDPLKKAPPVKACPKCKGKSFKPETDILDTWATSSLTPQLCTELLKDKPIFKKLFPMSLRPQAHDIITFWLFNTMVKSQLHHNKNPWKDVVISGHALDPHGKKMSKSKGNVVEPQDVVGKYSADALRFWAAGSKLGDDMPYQEKDIFTGQKMITKLWNASKFSIMHIEDYKSKPNKLETIDLWLLTKLNKIIKRCTEDFKRYEYAKTKLETEKFFWHTYCDNYLEIVKDRLYNPDSRGEKPRTSAQYTLCHTTLSILKLMAPIMPHITEEIYQLHFKEKDTSIHVSPWPVINEQEMNEKSEKLGDFIVKVISLVRKKKNENKLSLKDPIKELDLKTDCSSKFFGTVVDDIKAVTKADNIKFTQSKSDFIDIKL